ncbi:peptidase domain-containing ABC transporter [Gloeobacter violaceus]|uniref:HlyB/MsbA family ABC transporter n=1 Tax=Gloeobacter violaceus (strain ATCC 29082 / PCC 7421) TaxID=251221 RepID=Q7NPN4_GLOVI|nr:ATP-binding cassette domain-containing protein [Gloeobacter violaceus]BAC87962.1 HlyB/MsbA family ABC transporter [Gloeobacter violaceus PCC 7421]
MSLLKTLPLIVPPTQGPSSEFLHEETEDNLSPYGKLVRLLREDLWDLVALGAYTVMVGLLSLAVPLAASALVNTIATGVYMQPLVVLTLLVLGCLTFAGVLKLMQLVLAERLQQRIFARIALRLAVRLPFIRQSALLNEYAPQLVNRFFDVVTAQKTLAKMLLTAPSALLSILVGMVLMAIYSPYLLAFDLFLIVFIVLVWVGLGNGGLETSIKESSKKYRVAEWLEELGRCQTGFKMSGVPSFPLERTDALVLEYIKARRLHFRVLFRQAVGNYLFSAVANAGILAIGGWLVINGQLTLGQLVAAELIVLTVLAALDKLIRTLEEFYDLLTSLEKLSQATELPVERQGGKPMLRSHRGASITCRNVRFAYRPGMEVLNGLYLSLKPGERVSLVGNSGAGKSTLSALLCGLLEPNHGAVAVNSVDVRDAKLHDLRQVVGLVSDTNDEVFEGTIEQNILLGRTDTPYEDLVLALEVSQLADELATLPDGLKTMLISGGRNLSRGQVQRILIARALVAQPQLLILDEAFTGIDEKDKLAILDNIYSGDHNWTILNISHDPEVVMRSDIVHVLADGRIVETGSPLEMAARPAGRFAALFPSLRAELVA